MTTAEREIAKQAESLLRSAQGFASTYAIKLLGRFGCVRSIDPEQWEFFVTVACLFVAVSDLSRLDLIEPAKEAIRDSVNQQVEAWDSQGKPACDNCSEFIDHRNGAFGYSDEPRDDPELLSDLLGSWVVCKLLNHAPATEDEQQLARVLGGITVRTFKNWWAA